MGKKEEILMSSVVQKLEFKLKSEDDLEAVVFSDVQSLLRDIANKDLYENLGKEDANILFHNSATMGYFFVLMNELTSQGSTRIVKQNGKNLNTSNLEAVSWFIDKYGNDPVVVGSNLQHSHRDLVERLDYIESFEVYNGEETLVFPLSIRESVNIFANLRKHTFINLDQIYAKLHGLWVKASGRSFSYEDTLKTIDPFLEELHGCLIFHASYLCELMIELSISINLIAYHRKQLWLAKCSDAGGPFTNLIDVPSGISSGFQSDKYRYGIYQLAYGPASQEEKRFKSMSSFKKGYYEIRRRNRKDAGQ